MNNSRTDTSREYSVNYTDLIAELTRRVSANQTSSEISDKLQTHKTSKLKNINPIELFYYFLSKIGYVIAGMVLGGIVLGIFASTTVKPIYTATSKLYIMGTTGSSIIYDLQIGSDLTYDYREVFKTWEVHQMVNDELGTEYSYSELQRMLTVTNPSNTRILYITVQNTDSQRAADIANAYAAAAKKFIVQIMRTDEPSDFSVALVPGVANSANITNLILAGMLAGTVLVSGVLLLSYKLDRCPKSSEDIMYYAGIPTLAIVPKDESMTEKGRKHKEEEERV